MFGEDQPRRAAGEYTSQSRIEERRILMGVQHFDAACANCSRHPPGDPEDRGQAGD